MSDKFEFTKEEEDQIWLLFDLEYGWERIMHEIESLINSRPEPSGGDEVWKLIGHSHQIADTGDYDGHYEVTNGKISLLTKDDEEESIQPIVDALNNSGCKFYQDDWFEFENKHIKSELAQLRSENDRLRSELEKVRDGWISVDDRLPEEDGEYLVKFTTGERRMGVVSYRKKKLRFFGFNQYVSHWQPLPTPPQTNPK